MVTEIQIQRAQEMLIALKTNSEESRQYREAGFRFSIANSRADTEQTVALAMQRDDVCVVDKLGAIWELIRVVNKHDVGTQFDSLIAAMRVYTEKNIMPHILDDYRIIADPIGMPAEQAARLNADSVHIEYSGKRYELCRAVKWHEI